MLREIRELARFVGKRTRNEVLSHVDHYEKGVGESECDPE
jgi:hypothetical protein